MGKYLIQDIIPTRKRQSTAKKEAMPHTQIPKVPHTKKDAPIDHGSGSEQLFSPPAIYDEMIHDPHTMIVDQIADGAEFSPAPAASAAIESEEPTPEVSGAWPYNTHDSPSASASYETPLRDTTTQQFPMRGGSDIGGGQNGGWLP